VVLSLKRSSGTNLLYLRLL